MMNTIKRTAKPGRVALTLVELMVVITIVSILAAIALPTIRNTLRDQKIPRSVNLVKAQFEVARSNAIRSGRPHGVILRRAGREDATARSHGFQLAMCASQPSYSGDTVDAETLLEVRTFNNAPNQYYLWFRPSESPNLLRAAREYFDGNAENAIVGPGDSVILCGGIGAGGELRIGSVRALSEGGGAGGGGGGGAAQSPVVQAFLQGENDGIYVQLNPAFLDYSARVRLNGYAGRTSCFTIHRSPRRSFDEPQQMIDGTTIDLIYSGIGTSGVQFSPMAIANDSSANSPVFSPLQPQNPGMQMSNEVGDFEEIWIIFNPDGRVERVYYGNAANGTTNDPVLLDFRLVHDTVYLLVGYIEGVLPTGPLSPAIDHGGEAPNLFRGDASWIALLAGSGQVVVAGVTPDDGLTDPNDPNNDQRLDPIALAQWQAATETARQSRLRSAVAAARENILMTPAGDL